MSTPLQQRHSIWADFNALDAERRVQASLRFAESLIRPTPGEIVTLHDGEGNIVDGVVEEVEDMVILVRPDMTTWRPEVRVLAVFVGEMGLTPKTTTSSMKATAEELQTS